MMRWSQLVDIWGSLSDGGLHYFIQIVAASRCLPHLKRLNVQDVSNITDQSLYALARHATNLQVGSGS